VEPTTPSVEAAYGLAWAAGAVHVVAALAHAGAPLHAVTLACLAAVQILWGIALRRSPSRLLLICGLGMCIAVLALWVLSRTSGIPIGPHPWTPEPVGALDSIASADEAVLALLAAATLRDGSPACLTRFLRPLGVCLILVSSLALTHIGHAH
jgi:hypothetical protein